MTIVNIIDRRTKPHRWREGAAIIEPTWHDNSIEDSDKAEAHAGETPYASAAPISVAGAMEWASSFTGEYTLHLYDCGAIDWGVNGRARPAPPLTPQRWRESDGDIQF